MRIIMMYKVTARKGKFEENLLDNKFEKNLIHDGKSYRLPENVIMHFSAKDFEWVLNIVDKIVQDMNLLESLEGEIKVSQILLHESGPWLGYP